MKRTTRAYNNAVKADAVIKGIKAGTGAILTWDRVENTTYWKINPSIKAEHNLYNQGYGL